MMDMAKIAELRTALKETSAERDEAKREYEDLDRKKTLALMKWAGARERAEKLTLQLAALLSGE